MQLPEESQTSHLKLLGEAPPKSWLAGCGAPHQDGGCHVAGLGFSSPSLGGLMASLMDWWSFV